MTRGIRRFKALGFPCWLLWQQNGLRLGRMGAGIRKLLADYRTLKRGGNQRFELSPCTLLPYTDDCVETTPLDPVYFYQDTWAAARYSSQSRQST